MPPRHVCGVCNDNIAGNTSSIFCVECERWIHFKCSGMNKTQFSKIANEIKNNGLKWKCDNCKSEVSVFIGDDPLDDHDERDEYLVQRMEQIFQKFFLPFKEDIEKSLARIKSDVSSIVKQNKAMSAKQAQLDARISAVEDKLKSFDGCGSNTEEVILEMNERKKRSCNVIALNVPESTKTTGVERLNDDRVKMSGLFPEQLYELVPNFKLRRLGRPGVGKPRRLLIVTPSEECAKSIFRATPAKDSNVLFKRDQTPAQQVFLEGLRKELDTLVRNGDDSKTIKYIGGVPRIIDKSFFRPFQEQQ